MPDVLSLVLDGGLWLHACADPDHPILRRYFESYDRAFVIAAEKESFEGFRDCLALNDGLPGADLRERYAPFRELVAIATFGRDGPIVGGANFVGFEFPAVGREVHDVVRTMSLNYLHVEPSCRRRGYSAQILGGCRTMVAQILDSRSAARSPPHSLPLVFVEQNDPLALDEAEYALDTEHAGIDQIERVLVWRHLGALVLDHPYVQPALAADARSACGLLLSVVGAERGGVPACVVEGHLERFFAISCLKGRPLESAPEAVGQLADLRRLCSGDRVLALLDPLPWIEAAKNGAVPPGRRRDTLVSALKRFGRNDGTP